MRFLCQEVLELTKSTPAIGSSDFTQLREEVQSLPRQGDLQQLRQVGSWHGPTCGSQRCHHFDLVRDFYRSCLEFLRCDDTEISTESLWFTLFHTTFFTFAVAATSTSYSSPDSLKHLLHTGLQNFGWLLVTWWFIDIYLLCFTSGRVVWRISLLAIIYRCNACNFPLTDLIRANVSFW